MRPATSMRRSDWLVPAGLILLSVVPAIAGTTRLTALVRGAEITVENARFVAAPLPILLHVVFVIPFSILGALQFSPMLRRRHPQWHRTMGKFLVVAGLMSALTGLWMTLTYPWPAGDGEGVYVLRLLFGSAMTISLVRAIDAIRHRSFVLHGEWMMRGYAIGLGAGTQVLTHIPWFILVGKPSGFPRAVLMGAGWVINVAVAEWVIRRQRQRLRALGSSGSSREAVRATPIRLRSA
jgi:uncharacterized membrane protein